MIVDMEHIIKLAQLEFTKKEKEELYRDMEDIVNMVGDLPDVVSAESPDERIMELRSDDVSTDKFTNEEMLRNAPVIYNGCIAVPKTVE
jgi:aspartyl/glutamyl-tRNA(Asn/Gln) amidotransferase C subunit